MGNPITYPNGTTLTSTALVPEQVQGIFQQLTCTMLGLTSGLPVTGTLVDGSAQVAVNSTTGISLGCLITDVMPAYGIGGYGAGGYGGSSNIPQGTTIVDISGLTLTMSAKATGSASDVTLYVTNPVANTAVRQTWLEQGAPAWGIIDDVCFVRAVLEANWYDKIRDQGVTQNMAGSVTTTREYTRVWRLFWSAYGPNCFDNMRAVQSGLLFELTTDPLSTVNLYVVPDMDTPAYVPELDDGQWWKRTTFEAQFYEQVTETITTQTVTSVEVLVYTEAGKALDFTVT